MELKNKKELISILKIDMNVRLAFVAVCLLIVFAMKAIGFEIPITRIGLFLILVLVFYIVFRLFLKSKLIGINLKYLFNFFDALLIVFGIDSTGGINSPFYLAFIIMPLAEAFTHSNRNIVLFSGIVPCIAYPAYFILIQNIEFTGANLGLLGARIAFIFVFTLISAYYQKIICEEKEKVERANREVQRMNQSLERLIEERTRELKDVQEQLIQSAKMVAVGQLASGTAHELNNPLTVIMGHAQLLLQNSPKDEDTRESLQEIETYTKKCRKIIQDMLGFSRQYKMKNEKLDINDVVNKAIELTRHKIKVQNVEVVKQFGKDLSPIKGNRSLMEQVLFNLLVNAQDAMPEGGNITITTENDGDGTVKIEVSDEGEGMDREQLSRVFDPFFTTKEIGKGTGLGLYVTYNIIGRLKGQIRVESEGKGKGARFIINLPRYEIV